MKIAVKRIYCPNCRRLVRIREMTANSQTLISCTQCGRQIYSWNGIRWKPLNEAAALK